MRNAFAACVVVAGFAVPQLALAQVTGYPPVGGAPVVGAPGPVAPAPGQHPRGEHHPEMHRALNQLEHAKQSLQSAAHDYSGHRDAAIRLIDQAEAEIRQGLETVR